MAAASIVLAFGAFACACIGFVTSVIPVVGSVFSFAAPLLALLGIVFGGLAVSQAKQSGGKSDAGLAGAILSALGLLPALMVAGTCGACNALVSTSVLSSGESDVRFDLGPVKVPLGRMPSASQSAGDEPDDPSLTPPPFDPGSDAAAPDPSAGQDPPGDAPDAPRGPSERPAGQDPSTLPPPPLPPGPGQR